MSYSNRTNYRYHLNKPGSIYKVILVVVILLLVGLLVYYPKEYLAKLRTKFNDAAIQSLSAVRHVNSSLFAFVSISDYLNLHKNYRVLQDENEQLRQTIFKLSYIDSENHSLRKLHHFAAKKGKIILSSYMIREAGFFGQEWILLAGSKDGIKEGQVVLNKESLVGRIISVGENVATILPITDVSSGIPVLLPRSENRGMLSGTYDGNLEIYILDKDVLPQPHDVVVSAGDGHFIPQGLLIGTVSHVSASGTLIVRPLSILNRTNLVSVIEY